jgi:hypothetical protein
VNKILRVYRNADVAHKLSECEAVKLLRPALGYYYSSFSPSGNDVVEFGLDVLSAQKLFYQDGLFCKYMLNIRGKEPPTYIDVKLKTDGQIY